MIHLYRTLIKLIHYSGPKPLKVIVTGSPRSGTSFVAGLVHRMGFSLGPKKWLKKGDEHNPYGYFECLPLKKISNKILEELGGDFHHNLPSLESGWTEAFESKKSEITRIIEAGGIELYKGNRLLVLADLYDELFPEAKWIFTQRSIKETYRSRFGEELSFGEWERITNERLRKWESCRPAKQALYVDYQDFKSDAKKTVSKIQAFLEIELTESQVGSCVDFFLPRR